MTKSFTKYMKELNQRLRNENDLLKKLLAEAKAECAELKQFCLTAEEVCEIKAQAVAEQSKILRSEPQPPMFRQCIDNACDWLDSRADQIKQGETK